ncbi:hypothetical protein AAEX28_05015 [Lentisphaerota bacterium WC36G]|nr:hypothetical protein LJT99_07870 [Lentisphaerae bacterium WC36]
MLKKYSFEIILSAFLVIIISCVIKYWIPLKSFVGINKEILTILSGILTALFTALLSILYTNWRLYKNEIQKKEREYDEFASICNAYTNEIISFLKRFLKRYGKIHESNIFENFNSDDQSIMLIENYKNKLSHLDYVRINNLSPASFENYEVGLEYLKYLNKNIENAKQKLKNENNSKENKNIYDYKEIYTSEFMNVVLCMVNALLELQCDANKKGIKIDINSKAFTIIPLEIHELLDDCEYFGKYQKDFDIAADNLTLSIGCGCLSKAMRLENGYNDLLSGTEKVHREMHQTGGNFKYPSFFNERN